MHRSIASLMNGQSSIEKPWYSFNQETLFMLGVVATLGLAFQIGHFLEHAFQFGIWILGDLSNICGRDTAWMSAIGEDLVKIIGTGLSTELTVPQRRQLGLEVLHLIGNGIFLASLIALYFCMPIKWTRWAVYIEAFHLMEHVALTLSMLYVGKPIGISTLFGYAGQLGSREFSVGYRVSWHFVMNLFPMPFAMIGVVEYLHARTLVKARAARSSTYKRV
jgi:hypothetical protein